MQRTPGSFIKNGKERIPNPDIPPIPCYTMGGVLGQGQGPHFYTVQAPDRHRERSAKAKVLTFISSRQA